MTALLRQRLVRRSVLLAQVAALGVASFAANAAVIDSGTVNIPVPATTAGVYLNVVTNVNNPSPAAVPGWDFNPFSATLAFFGSNTATNITNMASAGGVVTIFTPGQTVSAANTFNTGTQATTGTACRTTTTTACIVGFRFNREATTTTHFGYAVVSTTAPNGQPAVITRYVWEDTPLTAITVTAGGGGNVPPQFAYAPASGGTVNFTGGGAVGSTGTGTVTVTVGTPGSGTGAPATTTTTCTAPAAPFAGFGQSVTATGNGAITGSPLSGTCTLGAAPATATLTCSENRGGTAVPVTFQLSCPAGTLAPVTSTPPSGTTIAFGNITPGGTATQNITFNNSAGTPQTVTCTPTAAPFTTAPLSIPVPAGGSASTTITFNGTTTGQFTGTLNCTAGAATFTFPITGGVVPIAVATNVPALGDAGRWIAILMLLGVGLAAMVVRKH